MEIWTSGAYEGLDCDVNNMLSWCRVEGLVRKQEVLVNWAITTKAPAVTDRCLNLKLEAGKFAIMSSDCSKDVHSYICEVRNI
jgi:hypothetical protein